MLSTIRKRVRLIMIFVAVTFVAGFLLGELWTMLRSRQTNTPESRGVIARVGDHEVKAEEFRGAIAYTTDKYKQENNLRDLSTQDYDAIENRAWQWLIGELTWSDLFKRTGTTVTQDEIIEIMKANPPEELRQNPSLADSAGNFDHQKYLEAMNNEQNQPYFARYFQELAEMLPKEKLRIDMANSFRVTQAELARIQREEGTQVRVTALYFGPRLVADAIEPTDEEAKQYFDAHQDEFKPKAVRQLAYVAFPMQLTPADSAEARATIDRALEQLRGGESFNNTILDFSDLLPETTSTYVPADRFDPTTDSVVRALKPGQRSDAFLAPYGWQIVTLDSAKTDSVALRRVLVRIKMSAETAGNVRDEVRSFLDLAGNAGFDSLAQTKGMRVNRLRPLVGEEPELTGLDIVSPERVTEWAVKAKDGDVMPDPARGPAGYYAFRLVEHKPAVVPPFDDVKRQAVWRVKQEKEKEIWTGAARTALAEVKAGKPLAAFAADSAKVELTTEEYAGLTDCRRRKGPEFAGAVDALEPGQTSGVVTTNWGAFIIRCDARTPVEGYSPVEFAQQRQQELTQQVMRGLLEAPTVKDYRDPLGY